VSAVNIIVTIGLATASTQALDRLLRMGVVNFRIPLAKQLPEGHLKTAQQIARLAKQYDRKINVIMDLPGSKPRLTNRTQDYVELGEIVEFSFNESHSLPLSSKVKRFGVSGLESADLSSGKLAISGDGELAFTIEDINQYTFRARALRAGRLGPFRGLTLEGAHSSFLTLTEQDKQSLALLNEDGFTSVMLSFVESAGTIRRARQMIDSIVRRDRARLDIIAKVETLRGVTSIAEICAASEGVVLGRGDLLLSVGPSEFFAAEENVIGSVMAARKPLFVGTQLLSSMSDDWLPNRSELSHLSHLIAKGVDGFLLSFETSAGKNPYGSIELLQTLYGRYSPHPTKGQPRDDRVQFPPSGGPDNTLLPRTI
jgi:pyruvate kinase